MQSTPDILREVEQFLAETGMGESYFGKKAIGNSELVKRLRAGGRIWPETAAKVRSFIGEHSADGSCLPPDNRNDDGAVQ